MRHQTVPSVALCVSSCLPALPPAHHHSRATLCLLSHEFVSKHVVGCLIGGHKASL